MGRASLAYKSLVSDRSVSAKIGHLLDGGLSITATLKEVSIDARAYRRWAADEDRQWWRDRRKPAPEVSTESKIASALTAIASGSPVATAFAARGLSERAVSKLLAEAPKLRNKIAAAAAQLEEQLATGLVRQASLDSKASIWLLKTLYPTRFESAEVRQKLGDTSSTPEAIVDGLQVAFAFTAASHASQPGQLQQLLDEGKLSADLEDKAQALIDRLNAVDHTAASIKRAAAAEAAGSRPVHVTGENPEAAARRLARKVVLRDLRGDACHLAETPEGEAAIEALVDEQLALNAASLEASKNEGNNLLSVEAAE